MPEVQITDGFRAAHGALAARIAGLGQAAIAAKGTVLCDAAETVKGAIAVTRAAVGRIARGDDGRRELCYADPAGDAAMAALIACLGENGAPVAADPESLSVLALADRLAQTDIPVLIGGPTGTGKEVLSRFVHARSPRAGRAFIAVNCAAIPETMLEAMLFGHAKGSFTGANAAGEGFFRAADGGTLMLDEIAEMPLNLQAKLLRALQEGEVVPVGATRPVKVDVRIIAAANRDLPAEVAAGRFREDLFYRLNVFPITLRPLCERPADIAPLAFAMVLRHAQGQAVVPWLDDCALAMLQSHSWPGNVRELENVIRRALVLSCGAEVIGADSIAFDQRLRALPPAATDRPGGEDKLANIVQLSEARAILATLDACDGKRGEAARKLGISERTLRYRMASMRDAGIAVGAGR